MDIAKVIRKGEEQNWTNLEPYLREHLPVGEAPFSVKQFYGGHANLTYLISFGDQEYVLRRPPFGKLAPGTHSMKREYRVLSQLYKYFPQAPRAFLVCDNQEIIGADFVVMERRTGVVVRTVMIDEFKDMDNVESRLATAMTKMLATLHNIDIEKANLTHLGKPEGYLERQLAGWTKRADIAKTEADDPVSKEISEILTQNIPTTQRISVIHNDIKLDNCQFQPDNPDEVSSVFDWDMCTIGDPLVDLGTALGYWPDKNLNMDKLPIQLQGDYPPKEFIIDLYKKKTGLDMTELYWYEGFSFWKAAVIAQQLYKRYADGQTKDERMKYFGHTAKVLSNIALQKLKTA